MFQNSNVDGHHVTIKSSHQISCNMKPPTAYSILKELGNNRLRNYIYENIPEPIFDSHRITNPFP